MNRKLMFSSKTDNWATPRVFAAECVKKYGINFDVCASAENAVVPQFIGPPADSLALASWHAPGRVCWMNPPYGRQIAAWVSKAAQTAARGTPVVCLLPARTDTAWWHEIIVPRARRVEFIRGRLHFNDGPTGAPFPSVLVFFG